MTSKSILPTSFALRIPRRPRFYVALCKTLHFSSHKATFLSLKSCVSFCPFLRFFRQYFPCEYFGNQQFALAYSTVGTGVLNVRYWRTQRSVLEYLTFGTDEIIVDNLSHLYSVESRHALSGCLFCVRCEPFFVRNSPHIRTKFLSLFSHICTFFSRPHKITEYLCTVNSHWKHPHWNKLNLTILFTLKTSIS